MGKSKVLTSLVKAQQEELDDLRARVKVIEELLEKNGTLNVDKGQGQDLETEGQRSAESMEWAGIRIDSVVSLAVPPFALETGTKHCDHIDEPAEADSGISVCTPSVVEGGAADLEKNAYAEVAVEEGAVALEDKARTDSVVEEDAAHLKGVAAAPQAPRLKRFLCSYCAKAFHRKGSLRRHENTHTAEMPYSCPFCSLRFNRKGILQRHIRTAHTKKKPYDCPLCSRHFGERGQFRAHLVTHISMKEKPWKCTVCVASYSTKKSLNVHRIKKHKGESA